MVLLFLLNKAISCQHSAISKLKKLIINNKLTLRFQYQLVLADC